jgi:hypothetical protein
MDNLNAILQSIDSVKRRARKAIDSQRIQEYAGLCLDLIALYECLESETRLQLDKSRVNVIPLKKAA